MNDTRKWNISLWQGILVGVLIGSVSYLVVDQFTEPEPQPSAIEQRVERLNERLERWIVQEDRKELAVLRELSNAIDAIDAGNGDGECGLQEALADLLLQELEDRQARDQREAGEPPG